MNTVVYADFDGPTQVFARQQVVLSGLDYYARRRRLFTALRALVTGEQLELISERAEDVTWLRFEVEARIPQRYCWSLPEDSRGAAHTVVQLP